MANIEINTSQNVNLSFVPASIGERIAAFVIDLAIKAAYIAALFYVLFRILNADTLLDRLDEYGRAAVIMLLMLPVVVYTLVLESLMEGQTFGKKILKIRVLKIDGYQAGFGDYLIRWFFRIVDIYVDSGIVGILTMLLSKNGRRLGDMASGTAVVSLKNAVQLSHTILENIKEDYIPAFPQVIALSDNDMRIIKDNFINGVKRGDQALIEKLSAKICETLKLEAVPREYSNRNFINKVIMDYNFYTGREI